MKTHVTMQVSRSYKFTSTNNAPKSSALSFYFMIHIILEIFMFVIYIIINYWF